MNVDQAKAEIDEILGRYRERKAAGAAKPSLLPADITTGKLYEAWVLCDVLRELREHENYEIVLREGTKVWLKTGGGPINRSYPHFAAAAPGQRNLEIWTDIFFLTLSHHRRGAPDSPSDGDFHELDVVVVRADTDGFPQHGDVLIGVECKAVGGYDKDLLRQILGVRRELSYLHGLTQTGFFEWPHEFVRADPPSCLLVYSTDSAVTRYKPTGDIFSIDFIARALP